MNVIEVHLGPNVTRVFCQLQRRSAFKRQPGGHILDLDQKDEFKSTEKTFARNLSSGSGTTVGKQRIGTATFMKTSRA